MAIIKVRKTCFATRSKIQMYVKKEKNMIKHFASQQGYISAPKDKKEFDINDLFQLARKRFRFTALLTPKKYKKEKKRLEEAFEDKYIDSDTKKKSSTSELVDIILKSDIAEIEDIESAKALALYDTYHSSCTHYIREFIKKSVLPYHKKGNRFFFYSDAVEMLLNSYLYNTFIKWSIGINTEIKKYKTESLKHLGQKQYSSSDAQNQKKKKTEKIESEIKKLTETIEYLEELQARANEYKHIEKEKDELFESEIDGSKEDELEKLRDRFAEIVYDVITFNRIGMRVANISETTTKYILSLPEEEQNNWIERYHNSRERAIIDEIEEMVEQAKHDIVFDYITKHCISIDEEKLRNDISVEYTSESIPAHPVELENRLRLQDLSNYYTVITPKENQNKR